MKAGTKSIESTSEGLRGAKGKQALYCIKEDCYGQFGWQRGSKPFVPIWDEGFFNFKQKKEEGKNAQKIIYSGTY